MFLFTVLSCFLSSSLLTPSIMCPAGFIDFVSTETAEAGRIHIYEMDGKGKKKGSPGLFVILCYLLLLNIFPFRARYSQTLMPAGEKTTITKIFCFDSIVSP